MSRVPNRTKVTVGLVALVGTLGVALLSTFLMMQSVFPWMTVLNPVSAPPAAPDSGSGARNITHADPTLAEQVLADVMGTRTPDLRVAGWSEAKTSGGVPGVSFGFGCDPTDGLAPVVAESRSWVQTETVGGMPRATGTVDVSARAYPAGGGAVAFVGVSDAILRCDAASRYDSVGVGVEAFEVVTSRSRSIVWRRGDVLMVGTVTAQGGPGSVTAHMGTFARFDQALAAALSTTCVNPEAGLEDAARSPYVNRKEYTGRFEATQVKRDVDPAQVPAEVRATSPVVPIPAPSIAVPTVGELPDPPSPAVTLGPAALPSPVKYPVQPQAPGSEPSSVVTVRKGVPDEQGPGCGWAFTGQAAPVFDSASAQVAYERDVRAAKKQMATAWANWQDAKVSYYTAYARYAKTAERYRTYAKQVAEVLDAWAVVERARASYYGALDDYNEAVDAAEAWQTDRRQARAAYQSALLACASRSTEPQTVPTASSSPTAQVTPTVPTPGVFPSGGPSVAPDSPSTQPSDTPTLVCPPVRPKVLDAPRPTVPPSPVPAAEAQLPASSR